MWPWEHRAMLLQKMHLGVKFGLFFFGEAVPPSLELMSVLDLPGHVVEHNLNGIYCQWNDTRLSDTRRVFFTFSYADTWEGQTLAAQLYGEPANCCHYSLKVPTIAFRRHDPSSCLSQPKVP